MATTDVMQIKGGHYMAMKRLTHDQAAGRVSCSSRLPPGFPRRR